VPDEEFQLEVGSDAGFIQISLQLEPRAAEQLLAAIRAASPGISSAALRSLYADLYEELNR